jgi:prephenate dehydrogenase
MTGGGPVAGRRFLVVGGTGAVGSLFVERLVDSGAEVGVVDLNVPAVTCWPGPSFLRGDVTAIDGAFAAALAKADTVVLAVPEQVALDCVGELCRRLGPDTLLVDTLTVKEPFSEAVRRLDPARQSVGLNPMFAPSLGFAGRPVAAVVNSVGQAAQELLDQISQWGGRIVRVSAAEHDRLASVSQSLTHAAVIAFGLGAKELGIDISALSPVAPPPHTTMLALTARIANGAPEVYWDIQRGNPHAAQARQALAGGLRRIADLVGSDDEAGFAAVQAELRAFLGGELQHYGDLCARLFSVPATVAAAEHDVAA